MKKKMMMKKKQGKQVMDGFTAFTGADRSSKCDVMSDRPDPLSVSLPPPPSSTMRRNPIGSNISPDAR
jgi:hypothetical protein